MDNSFLDMIIKSNDEGRVITDEEHAI